MTFYVVIILVEPKSLNKKIKTNNKNTGEQDEWNYRYSRQNAILI